MKTDTERVFSGEKDIRFGQPNDWNEGISLRDCFALVAMHAMLSSGAENHPDATEDRGFTTVEKAAYKYADGMLVARKPQP